MSLGACRHCEYQPIASDAVRCPRCGGANPNPSIIGYGVSAIGLVILAIMVLGFCAVGSYLVAVLTGH